MLNATCQFEDPSFIVIIDWLGSCFSIPIYILAFSALFFKCTKFMNEYRNYLAVHILSGVLLEVDMGVFWKVRCPLPVAILCSAGLAAEHAQIAFVFFVYTLEFTAMSAVSLFIYRMKTATETTANCESKLEISVKYWNYIFYLGVTTCSLCTVLTYFDLKYQHAYKKEMEKVYLKLPDYMWCDNCFFMNFNSPTIVIFFVLAYLSISLGFVTGWIAAFVTYRTLTSNKAKLSERTAAMQKNFLSSLLISTFVHFCFIFIPLAVNLTANFVYLNALLLGLISPIMLQLHGSASTLAMMLTSNVLRKSLIDLVCFKSSSSPVSPNMITPSNAL